MLGSGTGAPVGRPPSLPCSGTLLGNKLCSHLLTSIPCRNRCPVSSRTARVVSHAASNEQPPAQPKLVTARPKLQASGVRHKEEKHPPLVVPHGNPLEGLNEEQRQAVFTDALTVRVKVRWHGPDSLSAAAVCVTPYDISTAARACSLTPKEPGYCTQSPEASCDPQQGPGATRWPPTASAAPLFPAPLHHCRNT